MSAKSRAILLWVVFHTIAAVLMAPMMYYKVPGMLSEFAFVIGALFGGAGTFCFLCFVIIAITEYEHQPEKDRVTELNRHAGAHNFLVAEQWSLYMQTRGDHSPEAQAKWAELNQEFQNEDARHRAADEPIMQRHLVAELSRSGIFSCFMIALGIAACILLFIPLPLP